MYGKLAIVDYGAGNLHSVAKALEWLGFPALITQTPQEILHAPGVILPGVGSSGSAMAALEARGLVEALRQVVAQGTPFFGVCMGLQLLLMESEESPKPCLGILPGKVKRLPTSVKVPHMGWNQVSLLRDHP
ncbi:imidazole glycerol phosphate synthase subunit HisH, partial [Dehalococcoidia bacterium]|nr:imidazole glycerol phosphate synthase subunit HisH [Dehalococcoidia bacterium]